MTNPNPLTSMTFHLFSKRCLKEPRNCFEWSKKEICCLSSISIRILCFDYGRARRSNLLAKTSKKLAHRKPMKTKMWKQFLPMHYRWGCKKSFTHCNGGKLVARSTLPSLTIFPCVLLWIKVMNKWYTIIFPFGIHPLEMKLGQFVCSTNKMLENMPWW